MRIGRILKTEDFTVAEPGFLDTLRQVSLGGDADQLVPLLYQELRRLAHAMKAARPRGATLQTTDLVHEAYLKLVRNED